MDTNKILYDVCDEIGKERSYKGTLTRKLNAIIKEKVNSGYDFLPKEQLDRIGIIALLKELGIEDIDKFFDDEDSKPDSGPESEEDDVLEEVLQEEEELTLDVKEDNEEFKELVQEKKEELKGLISNEGAEFLVRKELGIETIKKNKPVKKNVWNEFFATLPEKQDGNFVKHPSLLIKDNVTYYVKMKDPKEAPYKHEGVGYDKNPFTSWAFNIILIKVSSEDFDDETYEKGDFKGEPIYTNGREYKFWLSEKHRPTLAKFWTDVLGLDNFDGRVFAFRRTSKLSKNNRQYKIFKFMSVKTN